MDLQGLAETSMRARLLAACFLHLGQKQEAEAVIGPESTGTARERLPLLFEGIVRAQEGELDQAVPAFLTFVQEYPEEMAVRQAALRLLHRQAVKKINGRDWPAAETAVERLLALDPGYPGLRELLQVMEMTLPALALRSGRREEAARAWEEQQRQKPYQGIVAHSLALLYYHEALTLTRNGAADREQELDRWRRAVAHWTVVTYHDPFWAEWRRQREKIYTISEDRLAAVRKSWGEELAKTFRQQRTEMEAQGLRERREQYLELECREWLERVTAAAMQEVQKSICPHCHQPTGLAPGASGGWQCQQAHCRQPLPEPQSPPLPACGPLLLQQLGLEQQAQELSRAACQTQPGKVLSGEVQRFQLPLLKNNAEVLMHCLSPWNLGLAYVMHREFEGAITLLDRLEGKNPEARVWLLYAILERSRQLISQIPELPLEPEEARVREYLAPIQEALDLMKKGWQYRTTDAGLAGQLEELIEGLSVRAGNECKQASAPLANKKQWRQEISLLSHGIEILQRAFEITSRQRIKETLARLYAERGFSNLELDNKDAAIQDYEAALKLNPGDAQVRVRTAIAYNVRGCGRNGNAAIRDFDRAIELDGTRALYYRNRGIGYANMGQRGQAMIDLGKACAMEPGNQQFREELVRLML